MKIKTGLFYFALLLTLPAYAGHVVVDENAVGGAFNLTFYIEPTLYTGATYCLTFTKTGFLAGYAQSGTFADNAGDFQGTWYQSGDEILLSTIFPNAGEAAQMMGKLLSGASKFGGRYILDSTSIRRPPIPTGFPYPTLFRSLLDDPRGGADRPG